MFNPEGGNSASRSFWQFISLSVREIWSDEANFIVIGNQESLWRHGVVHDPTKKRMKVKHLCLTLSPHRLLFFACYCFPPHTRCITFPSRSCTQKRTSPGARRCNTGLQPIGRMLTSSPESCRTRLWCDVWRLS